MKRPATTIIVAAAVVGAAIVGVTGARRASGGSPCGEGFVHAGVRCCPTSDPALAPGLCAVTAAKSCPGALVATARGCDVPESSIVDVPATTVLVGPSDWEAEGRIRPRTVDAGPFRIDRFEITVGRAHCPTCPLPNASVYEGTDPGRAASQITIAEARVFCAARSGRLPSEDEWIVAAAGDKPRRYPWGDTGAVCRRGAWGLRRGPCGSGATGPDTAGAHPDGATPLGIHDLAGNVAEWVEAAPCTTVAACTAVARGGSFESELAADLRTWARQETGVGAASATIGFRCAYDAVRDPP